MTEAERAAITDERLNYYRHRMKEGNATPLFCIGTSEAGQAIVCLPHGVPLNVVVGLMKQAVNLIEKQGS